MTRGLAGWLVVTKVAQCQEKVGIARNGIGWKGGGSVKGRCPLSLAPEQPGISRSQSKRALSISRSCSGSRRARKDKAVRGLSPRNKPRERQPHFTH